MPGLNFLSPQSSKDEKEKSAKGKKMPVDKLGMNLISGDALDRIFQRIEKKDITQLIVAFFVSILLAGAMLGGVYIYGGPFRQEIGDLRAQRSKIEANIAKIESNKTALLAYQTKLTAFDALFKNHLYWTQFFTELEKNTLPNVQFDAISISTGYETSLSAHTTDYASVGRQLLAFQRATSFIKKVEITSANGALTPAGAISGVNFSVKLTIDPAVITKKYAAD